MDAVRFVIERRRMFAVTGENPKHSMFNMGTPAEVDVYPPQKAPAAPAVSSRSLFACTWRRLSPEASPIKR